MANTNFSGIVRVEEATTGTAFAAPNDLGELHEETACEREKPTESKNTAGQVVHAGQFAVGIVSGFDLAEFAALETKMLAGTKIDLRFFFPNVAGTNNDYVEVKSVLIENLEIVTASTSGQRNRWRFNYRGYTTSTFKFN